MVLYGALQTGGNTPLLAVAQKHSYPDDQHQNDAAQQHLLAPARLTLGHLWWPDPLA